MTMRHWGWGLALLALLTLAGCVKLDQTLTLNADGSGTLTMRYGMSEQSLAQLRAMEQMGAQSGAALSLGRQTFQFDPDQLRAELDRHRSAGVELKAVSSEVVDGWRYVDLEVDFEDIRALKRTELFQGSTLTIVPVGQNNYRITLPGGGNAAFSGDAAGRRLVGQMPEMLAGLRIVQTISVPGDIVESNAPLVDARRASWVFDLDEDPGVVDTLAQTTMELTFNRRGVTLPTVVP